MDDKKKFWRLFFHCEPSQAADFGNALEEHVLAVSWFEAKDPAIWVVEALGDFITFFND
ncbi:MAG: hypothetical protein K0R52_1335 [Alphaproteobacteria bacterium]|nr:hypothetical protein [Alphaproteobacteria bacterium]